MAQMFPTPLNCTELKRHSQFPLGAFVAHNFFSLSSMKLPFPFGKLCGCALHVWSEWTNKTPSVQLFPIEYCAVVITCIKWMNKRNYWKSMQTKSTFMENLNSFWLDWWGWQILSLSYTKRYMFGYRRVPTLWNPVHKETSIKWKIFWTA